MSAILALSAAHYTNMKNNAALNMINTNSARMNMLSTSEPTFDDDNMDLLCAMDTQAELDMITNNIQYLFAKAMLEQIKKQQKEDAKHFNIFA